MNGKELDARIAKFHKAAPKIAEEVTPELEQLWGAISTSRKLLDLTHSLIDDFYGADMDMFVARIKGAWLMMYQLGQEAAEVEMLDKLVAD